MENAFLQFLSSQMEVPNLYYRTIGQAIYVCFYPKGISINTFPVLKIASQFCDPAKVSAERGNLAVHRSISSISEVSK